MNKTTDTKTYLEPEQSIKIAAETDVLVVGGGPGGVGAAVSAARRGAKTILVERYGYLGGMGTGGLVTMFPHMSGGTKELMPGGLMADVINRLDEQNGAFHPPFEILGSDDPKLVAEWRARGMWFVSDEGRVRLTAYHDPELLKCIYNDIVLDAGVTMFLHCWGTKAIVKDGKVCGVVFESKSGRQAVMAKVVIDATGDADLLPSAGAESTNKMDFHLRIRNVALSFHVAGIDSEKFCRFAKEHPEEMDDISRGAFLNFGFVIVPRSLTGGLRDGCVWVNNFIPGMNRPLIDTSNFKDLTACEIYARKRVALTIDYYRKNCPGLENAYVMRTAPQLGIRGGRRLVGEYELVEQDVHTGREFDDTICAVPHLEHDVNEKFPLRNIPYRCLVPKKVDGLLVAGRSFCSQDRVNEMLNLMPHCMALGQAAGTAAAISIERGINVRNVDYAELRTRLREQGLYLPLNENEKKAGEPRNASAAQTEQK